MKHKINWLVIIGDAILLLAFAYGGEVAHELYYPDSLVLSVLHAALPFAIVWFPVAYLLGALDSPRAVRLGDMLVRALGAWLIAAPLGIVVRAWLINRAVIPVAFLLVTWSLGFALLLCGRLILITTAQILFRRPNENL